MRIAYFTDTYAPEINGVTNTLCRLGAYLDGKHIQQIVFAPEYNTDYSGTVSDYRKVIRFKGMNTALSTESRLAFPAVWEINKICDNFKPDIIHVTTELGIGFRGMRYALSHDIPLIMSFHTNYCKYLKYHNLDLIRPLLEKYLAWFYSLSDRTLVPSQHMLDELFSMGYRNLELWSRGVDTDCFNPLHRNEELRNELGKDKFIFLYAGRLFLEKNLDMLLYAASKIEERFPGKTAFVFTGDGPFSEIIQNSRLPNVVCTGFKRGRELSEIYASADCFAFPSGTETFGNVVLEALASGLPVAGVSSGGIMDFLFHGYNAILCPADNRDVFTDNLVSLFTDNDLRKRLADNARKSTLLRDWNQIFDVLINAYINAMDRNRKQLFRQTA